MHVTKTAFKIHGWVGLAAGLFFLLFGLTGSILVFRKALDKIPVVQTGDRYVPVDSIYRNIVRTHPDLKKIVLHDFPQHAHDCYEFMVYRNIHHYTDTYLDFIFVDPYTGKILKEGGYEQPSASVIRWLYSLHYTLLLGMPGRFMTAFMALLMLISLITGTIIYRKHFWNALRFKAGLRFKNRRTAISSLHRIVGVWTLVTNAVLFFTGMWMNLPTKWQLDSHMPGCEIKADLDRILQQAALVPGFDIIAVNIPVRAGQEVLVRGHMHSTRHPLLQGKASSIAFDPDNGTMTSSHHIEDQSIKERFDWMMYQLHVGAFGGTGLRWVYFLAGLAPGLLTITGAMLWFRRKRKRAAVHHR